MKTFKDLEFHKHHLDFNYAKIAEMSFSNGYGVSVILGSEFYSNGIDTYEVAILKDNDITHDTPITDDVLGYLTEEEVTEVMRKVQELK